MDSFLHPYFAFRNGGERAFSVESTPITFGPGALSEVGALARALGIRRAALLTDPRVAALPPFAVARSALADAGVDVVLHDRVVVEPTGAAILEAAAFARAAAVDGFVSLGGGSVIDTTKVANLLATWPDDLASYVSAPTGGGRPVPGPLKPHIACPTTFGTASETTGIAVFEPNPGAIKTGIVSRHLRPTRGLLDPDNLAHLPSPVVAANGFDVLSHAIESYTARPFTARPRPGSPAKRPSSQGANPFGDLACLEAIRLVAGNLTAAVADPADAPARQRLMFAGLLAGIGFGNAGNHLPHAMSYPVAHEARDFRFPGYPRDEPLVPHGVAVIVNSPAALRFTSRATPSRHGEALRALGVEPGSLAPDAIGEALAARLIGLMRANDMPNGLSGLGYDERDVDTLAVGALREARLVDNAPVTVGLEDVKTLFRDALRYW